MANGFIYDRENHRGYFNDKLIPSITQLIGLRYPLVGVSQELLDKASAYGTNVHSDCEMVANGLSEPTTLEGMNFEHIFNTLGFVSVETEKQVLFFNDYHEVVAYGTYDGLFKATKNVVYDTKSKSIITKENLEEEDIVLIKVGTIVLYDIKTTSAFDNEKVSLQTSLYSLAETEYDIGMVVGLWLRETTAQIRFLDLDKDNAQETLNELLVEWTNENGNI